MATNLRTEKLRRSSAWGLWLLLGLWLGGCAARDTPVKEDALIRIPHEGEPMAIRPGEVFYRDFELEAGEFLHLVAHQHGIDVGVRLRDPGGEVLVQLNSPTGTEGPEELVEVVEAPGVYRFEVVGPEEGVDAGEFVLQVLARREATTADREQVLADHAYHEGRALLRGADRREAIPKLRGALGTWVRLGQSRREADTRHALCRAHQILSEFDLAIVYCDQALELYRALGERLMMAVTSSRAGSIHQRLGQVQRSVRSFEEALALFREVGSEREVALTLAQLGTAHHRLGDLRRALDSFERALPMIERSASSQQEYAGVLLSKGSVLLALNRPWDALDHYSRAEEIYRRLEDERQLARALNRVANAALRLGELEKAEEDLAEAIGILRASEQKTSTIDRELALAQLYLGRVRVRKGQLDEGGAAFDEALERSRQARDSQIEAAVRMELGRLAVTRGRPADGLRQLDQAFDVFTEIEDLTGQAMARLRSAEALRGLGRLDEAWRRLAPALDVPEKLRTASDRFDVRTDYFAFRQEFFELAIDVLMSLDAEEPEAGHHLRALEIHERRRARELLDVLAEVPAASRQEADATLLAEEGRLEEELRALTGAAEPQDLDEKVGHLVDGLQRVRGEIRRTTRPAAASAPPAPVRLEQILESVLDEDSLILVYSLGERRSFLWAISSRAEGAHELPPRRVIEGLARRFFENLRIQSSRSPVARSRIARELSDILLAPVASEIGGHRRLLVVPAGDLQRIPFAALPAPRAARDDDYLVRHHEIVLLPSISALVSLRRAEAGRQAPRRSIAAFADPVFRADDPRIRNLTGDPSPPSAGGFPPPALGNGAQTRALHRLTDRLGFDPYERLGYSRVEVESILALAPEEDHLLAVDFAASRETFATHELGEFRILHFATHAFQDQDHPELSGLVLSLVDQEGKVRDGFLRAFEISRLRLPVELVVLSACQTGRGKAIPGEGVLGLTRAFFEAGAARVVSSLWRVSDRSTARLMVSFYEAHLGSGRAPAAALRQAQLTMLEDPQTAAPFHWAGFIFQGEWRDTPATPPPFQKGQEDDMPEEKKSYSSIDPPEVDPPEDPASTADPGEGDDVADEVRQELSDAAAAALGRLQKEES